MLRLISFVFILFFYSCSDNVITERNEEGVLLKTYSIDKDSLLHGELISYYDDGTSLFEKANYQHGKLHGQRTLYFENGQVEVLEEYHNDVLSDTLHVFYESGQLKSKSPYNHGILTGTATFYTIDGDIKEIVEFADNVENGAFKEFYPSGQVKWEGNYRNGPNEYGELIQYNEAGQVIKKMLCDEEAICRTTFTLEDNSASE